MSEQSVIAVVATFNRRALLMECLEALARQTHALAEIVVVDNASTDGTLDVLEAGNLPSPVPITYLRVQRNGGAAEGEHYGMAAALERGSEWVWVMDDDCAPEASTLEALLASPRAAEPETVALAPLAMSAAGEPLPLDRGSIRRRWFLAPLVAAGREDGPETEIDFATFVGPLVRADAAARAGLPLRRAFIRNEDVEYFARLRRHGRAWLVRDSVIVHKADRPFTDASLSGRLREYVRPDPFAQQWKHLCALRNLVYAGRRHGFFTGARAVSYVATQAARRLFFAEHRVRSAYLAALFGLHGWRGEFLNVPPERWAGVARSRRPAAYLREHALSYEQDVVDAPRVLASGP